MNHKRRLDLEIDQEDEPTAKRQKTHHHYALPNLHRFLSFVERNAQRLQLLGNDGRVSLRWIAYRIMYVDKWLGKLSPVNEYMIDEFKFSAEVADSLWKQVQDDFKHDGVLTSLRVIFTSGIDAYDQWIADQWFPNLAECFISACDRRRRAVKCVEMWKFKAARPGTALYTRVVSDLSAQFDGSKRLQDVNRVDILK